MRRRKPGPHKGNRANFTPASVENKLNRNVKCIVHGCCWRGTCPVHSRPFPVAYNQIAQMIAARPFTPSKDRDCALDLDLEVRERRLAFRGESLAIEVVA